MSCSAPWACAPESFGYYCTKYCLLNIYTDLSITYEKLWELFSSADVNLLEKHLSTPQSEGSETCEDESIRIKACLKFYAGKKPTWKNIEENLRKCDLISEADDVNVIYIEGKHIL